MSPGSQLPDRAHLPLVVADALVGVMAVWQIVALVAVYGGLSFDTLFVLGFAALAGLGLPWLTRPWVGEGSQVEPVGPPAVAWSLALLLALSAWAGFHLGGLPLHLVAFAMAPLPWLFVAPSHPVGGRSSPTANRWDALAIVGVGLAAAMVTLNLRRPDVDDAYYVNAVLQTLEAPHLAVSSFDGIHGEPGAPIQQVIHRPQTFELWIAWWSRLTGISGRWMYWVLAPTVAASTVGLVHWALVKRLAPRLAPLALVFGLAALCMWGDGLQTIGRFSFARLYQGKSVFVTCAVPLLAAAMLVHAQRPSWRSGLRLFAAAFGATAFTSTALVVVPIALAFGGVASLRWDRRSVLTMLSTWSAAVPVVAVLSLMYLELQAAGGLASDGHEMRATAALGRFRSAMVLMALAGLPWWLGGRGGAVWVARLVGPALLLLLNGAVPGWLGDRAAELLNWRTFWAMPFAPLLGLVGAAGLQACWTAWTRRDVADGLRALVAVGLVIAFAVRGSWAVQGDNIGYRFAAEKTRDRYEQVADMVLAHAGPDDLVAAGPHVSQALAMRPRKPRLNAVWIRYVLNLTRHWGEAETERRLSILEFVRGKSRSVPRLELQEQCVTVLVTVPVHRSQGDSMRTLPVLGFERVASHRATDVWQRDASELPEGCERPPVRE